jgi:hypothetical protein
VYRHTCRAVPGCTKAGGPTTEVMGKRTRDATSALSTPAKLPPDSVDVLEIACYPAGVRKYDNTTPLRMGILRLSQFEQDDKSRCVEVRVDGEPRTMTLTAFEEWGGKGMQKKWKESIRVPLVVNEKGVPNKLGDWLKEHPQLSKKPKA